MIPAATVACRGCGVALPPDALVCPSCHWLVHGDVLKTIAAEATHLETTGDSSGALALWRRALALLPPESNQHRTIAARAERLSGAIAAAPSASAKSTAPAWAKRLGPFGVVVAFLWKLKFLVVALVTKGKFLLLGLTKATTLFSMLLSLAAYWSLFGWRFAAGLIGSIYVHEMGHVAAMRRFGLPASAPMFIPGVGAFVRLQARPTTPVEDARVGLAGPIWGLGAALVAFGVGRALGSPMWLAIAHTAAWINLFNLLPVWQLDGSRGFAALTRLQRALVASSFVAAWIAAGETLFLLLAIVAGLRSAGRDTPATGDRTTLVQFVALVAALAFVAAATR